MNTGNNMDNNNIKGNGEKDSDEFNRYARKRIFAGILIAIVGLWVFGSIIGFFNKDTGIYVAEKQQTETTRVLQLQDKAENTAIPEKKAEHLSEPVEKQPTAKQHETQPPHQTVAEQKIPAQKTEHAQKGHGGTTSPLSRYPVKGMAFVNATIEPLFHEIEERFWGWRPNDIIDFTDNINNYQLGVLEVTRRTAVVLAQRISRTGATASFDKDLINAMDWFMVKYDRYWFPSPESKYSEGLAALQKYFVKIGRGEAKFYTRNENLIPLLKEYENILGSCDDNLVKPYEENGKKVSWFKTDDYFFHAQGVAATLHRILEAIAVDFSVAIKARGAEEDLHHAILSCQHAIDIKPIIITDSSYSGILANHRANMAAHISHARFYIGVVIKTLST